MVYGYVCGIQKVGRQGQGSNIAQQSCNHIATVWGMQAARKNARTIDSCTHDSK